MRRSIRPERATRWFRPTDRRSDIRSRSGLGEVCAGPLAESGSLAAQLLGRLTSPSQAAIKAETRLRIQEVLNGMEPLDREILALRHFEQLTNAEVTAILEMNESTASSRYVRALKRLKDELSQYPGWFGN
jgi:RNA polymerase sigma-70 factor (ECF subfamily)